MRWWSSPWWSAVGSVLSACLVLLGVCVPSGYYSVLVMALVGWGVVGVAWSVAGLSCFREPPHPLRRRPSRLWPLLIAPAVFASSWAAASGDLVGRTVFPWHRAALERLAVEASARQSGMPPYGGSAGLYTFEHIGSHEGCTFMSTSDRGMNGGIGFAWCPGRGTGGVVVYDAPHHLSPLEGDWYVFYRSRSAGEHLWGLRPGELSPPVET